MVERLKRGLRHPSLFGRAFNRLYHTRLHTRDFYPGGVDSMAEDWDNLILLDACRYDTFEQEHGLPGRLEKRVSRGPCTLEFLRGNFRDREMTDTVYVTANPQLARHHDDIGAAFHRVEHVWQDAWNEEHNTVLPEDMARAGIEAAETYTDKRLVIHFLQPHYPFILSETERERYGYEPVEFEAKFWQGVRGGKALHGDRETAREVYRKNLHKALPHIEDLMKELSGKTVVSSDHGNMLGHKASPVPVREWGHPVGVYTPGLLKVPWLVHDTGERREIRKGDAAEEEEEVEEAEIRKRLEALGYQ